jgi:cyclin A
VTPLHFVNEFLRANHACPDRSCEFDHAVLRQMVMYLLELCRIPYELTASKPSLLAAASLYLARATLGLRETDSDHAVDSNGYWTKTLQYYTGYAIDDLKKTVLTIHQYQLAAEESNFNASFNKYRSRAFKAVSLKTALRVEDLGFDATVNYDDLKIDESGARFSGGAAK